MASSDDEAIHLAHHHRHATRSALAAYGVTGVPTYGSSSYGDQYYGGLTVTSPAQFSDQVDNDGDADDAPAGAGGSGAGGSSGGATGGAT